MTDHLPSKCQCAALRLAAQVGRQFEGSLVPAPLFVQIVNLFVRGPEPQKIRALVEGGWVTHEEEDDAYRVRSLRLPSDGITLPGVKTYELPQAAVSNLLSHWRAGVRHIDRAHTMIAHDQTRSNDEAVPVCVETPRLTQEATQMKRPRKRQPLLEGKNVQKKTASVKGTIKLSDGIFRALQALYTFTPTAEDGLFTHLDATPLFEQEGVTGRTCAILYRLHTSGLLEAAGGTAKSKTNPLRYRRVPDLSVCNNKTGEVIVYEPPGAQESSAPPTNENALEDPKPEPPVIDTPAPMDEPVRERLVATIETLRDERDALENNLGELQNSLAAKAPRAYVLKIQADAISAQMHMSEPKTTEYYELFPALEKSYTELQNEIRVLNCAALEQSIKDLCVRRRVLDIKLAALEAALPAD